MLRFLDYSVIHARILTASIKSIILSDESRRIHAFARSFHLDIIYLQKRTRNKRCMNNIMVCIMQGRNSSQVFENYARK